VTRIARRSLIVMAALLPCGMPHAGQGAAELALDRSAVTELLAAAVPERIVVSAPGLGELGIDVGPPSRVEFRDGAVEATFPLRIEGLEWTGPLWVRYRPVVEPKYGTVRLVPAAAELPAPLDLAPDPTRWMPAVDLPRRLDWDVDLERGGRLRVRCYLQGVKIDDERLVVQLGLQLSGRVAPGGAPAEDRRREDQVVPAG